MEARIFWDRSPSPIGTVFVAVNRHGAVVRLTYGLTQGEFLEEAGPGAVRDREAVAPVFAQLAEYFAGERRAFDVPVDLAGLTPFQREVLSATRAIPFGEVRTYGKVAALIGRPRASRAVGRALSQNPIAVIVPCHRVIASDGSLRGYTGAGGIATKRFLLELEGYRPA
jgi:O-6-methylguanine DNA methyltransferase